MSIRSASVPHIDSEFSPGSASSVPRSRRPHRRLILLRVLLAALLAVLLPLTILVLSPPVLEAMTAMIIKPQPGAIPWNGRDRITLVLMGLTQRTTEPARTDTLLVMDVDPVHHKVHMLSVPRDLWVNIPGYGQGKLAIAYEVGGPRLAAYTLEQALGIPVDYTMALTFRGFTRIIDSMGGVNVNVPVELKDPTYPCLVGYAYCPIDIKAGPQHMDGATALEFVRERHAFAQQDLARVKDQQAFADAVKRSLISPLTWVRFPDTLKTFESNLITNLPLNALPAIGVQYAFPFGHVDHSYINVENGMVQSSWSGDGQSILVPTNDTVIPNLVHRLFSDDQLAQEHATVAVLNGTPTVGVAADAASTLQRLGFQIGTVGNADQSTYRQSEVIVNTAVPGDGQYTARRLQRLLNARLVQQPVPGQSARVVAIIGSDFP